MRKSFLSFLSAAVLSAVIAPHLHATGGWVPARWLDNGGIASDMSPEFYWQIELERMAREFTPPEKRTPLPEPEEPITQDKARAAGAGLTGTVDVADFEDALKTGRIKPPDPAQAKDSHAKARDQLAEHKSVPDEFPSEFADYHRGALAFQIADYDAAQAAWEALLKRPEAERHYRTVWAAFMLGKLALAKGDPAAVQWFQKTREFARAGFADTLGLAADSYGWEARSELTQKHLEAAAKLYLTQLALGDQSAIVSLKAVIPDRPPVYGMLNYSESPPKSAEIEAITHWQETEAAEMQKRLDECARSPLLRRLVTAHVLATETQDEFWTYGYFDPSNAPQRGPRCERWLATLEKAGLHKIDDADHLGWVAYTAGRYKEAARWLAVAPPTTPAALWLKAKLERREGKLAQAAVSMAAAFKDIKTAAPPQPSDQIGFTYGYGGYRPEQSAAGDLAGLHLTRGDFVNAMDIFLQGDLWDDAAFVADRILTVDELKKYVDTHFSKPTPEKERRQYFEPEDTTTRIRWLLARRLVRAHRFDEAVPYFKQKEKATLALYVAAEKDADDNQKPKLARAKALFTMAWITRYSGMELMGTEVEPDGFIVEGAFAQGHRDTERLESVRFREREGGDGDLKKIRTRLSIPASPAEKQRLVANAPHPLRRFHYRWIAADLAWRAAALLPDGAEELADVLNTGGDWIEHEDGKGSDKFLQAIERRCPQTEIGKAELQKHQFVNQRGPWSQPLKQQDATQKDSSQ